MTMVSSRFASFTSCFVTSSPFQDCLTQHYHSKQLYPSEYIRGRICMLATPRAAPWWITLSMCRVPYINVRKKTDRTDWQTDDRRPPLKYVFSSYAEQKKWFDYRMMRCGIFSMRWASASRGSVSGSGYSC